MGVAGGAAGRQLETSGEASKRPESRARATPGHVHDRVWGQGQGSFLRAPAADAADAALAVPLFPPGPLSVAACPWDHHHKPRNRLTPRRLKGPHRSHGQLCSDPPVSLAASCPPFAGCWPARARCWLSAGSPTTNCPAPTARLQQTAGREARVGSKMSRSIYKHNACY